MIGPTSEDLRDMVRWWPLTGFWAAGWLVSHTPIPADARTILGVIMGLAPVAVLAALAQWTEMELTGGRCRARNKGDGLRCSLHRPPNRDLCHVHQRTHGVELVDPERWERSR